MATLTELKARADQHCTERGHTIDWAPPWHGEGKSTMEGACRYCEKTVHINTNPLPNEIDCGGEALAMGCDLEYTPFRSGAGANEEEGEKNTRAIARAVSGELVRLDCGTLFAKKNERLITFDRWGYSTDDDDDELDQVGWDAAVKYLNKPLVSAYQHPKMKYAIEVIEHALDGTHLHSGWIANDDEMGWVDTMEESQFLLNDIQSVIDYIVGDVDTICNKYSSFRIVAHRPKKFVMTPPEPAPNTCRVCGHHMTDEECGDVGPEELVCNACAGICDYCGLNLNDHARECKQSSS